MKKLILIVVILAAAGGGYYYYKLRNARPEPVVVTQPLSRGDVVDTVGATGTLEAVETVDVGTQVSGVVRELYADFNSIVKKGQVIARLDPQLIETQIEQQAANVQRAEADLDRLKVALADARQKLERAQAMSAKQLIPKTDLETAEVNVRSAEAQIKSSEASLTQARAQLNNQRVNLGYTTIIAPIDGIIISRNVDQGQTVASSMNAPTLYVIAADLTKMQVLANIDEADVGRMRPGQRVTFRVDAFPTDNFVGEVSQVRLQPTTVQNVVTYSTVIAVPNSELKLKPGMTANVNIEIARKNNVLRIPNAATRFRPTTEMFQVLNQAVPPELERGRGGRGRGDGQRAGFGGNFPGGGPGGQGQGQPAAAGGATPPGAGRAPAAAQATTPAPQRPQASASAAQDRGPRAGNGGAGSGNGGRPTQDGGTQAGGAQAGGSQAGGSQAGGGGGQPGEGFGGRGGGRGGFDPNMTPEERQKRREERLAQMTPEQREQFQARMREGGGGRGGFGGGNRDGGGGAFGGNREGGAGVGGNREGGNRQGAGAAAPAAQAGNRQGGGRGGQASSPTVTAQGATTIDSLFGPLPVVESRGTAWQYENKQLKALRLRLGVSDGTFTEILNESDVPANAEVVTSMTTGLEQRNTNQNQQNNPLLGPQRGQPGRGGPGGGGFGGGGGGGGRGRG
jgi:HlyD family secretion protein